MNNIKFRKLKDIKEDYEMLFYWCQKPDIYKYFEQRKLTYSEIVNKYQKRTLKDSKIKVMIIESNNVPIGMIQFYSYEDNILDLSAYKNIYEFDIFIGEDTYRHKGIGTEIIKEFIHYLIINYEVDAIVLRPFEENITAIKCYEKCGFKTIYNYLDVDTLDNKQKYVFMINDLKK